MLNTEVICEWVDVLRSGKYKQGKSALHNGNDEFCCLGVLCEMAVEAAIIPFNSFDSDGGVYRYGTHSLDLCKSEAAYLPIEVMEWTGLSRSPEVVSGYALSLLNDDGKSFEEIADVIESSLEEGRLR